MPTVAPSILAATVVGAAFLGDVPFFALADGTIHRLDHGHKVGEAHDGHARRAFATRRPVRV